MATSTRDHCVSALLVGEYGSDRPLLHGIFRDAGWRLWEAPDRRQALDCLERQAVQVVISEKDGPQWHWKWLLTDLRRLANPPQLIVTSHTADDSLWAEVLNIGGYDVLPQPFNRDEVERVVASARRHFAGTHPTARPASPVAARGAA
jgi:DNA-binding response OmpR family regulator